jgi:hypothetical protein
LNIKIPRIKQKLIHMVSIPMWENETHSKTDIYSCKCMHHNLERSQIINLMMHSRVLEK